MEKFELLDLEGRVPQIDIVFGQGLYAGPVEREAAGKGLNLELPATRVDQEALK